MWAKLPCWLHTLAAGVQGQSASALL